MNINKTLKCALFTVLFFCLTSSVFAVEEYVSRVYKEIDVVFVKRSDSELDSILKENIDDKYYYLMENYSKKKVRRLLIDNEYEFAMSAIYIIIDNNIDGDFEDEDAIDLYSTISEAYEIQQQYELAQAIKAAEEQAKKEAEKEKLRTVVEKDYKVATTSEGKRVYLSSVDERSSSYRWDMKFGMIDFGVTTAQKLSSPVFGEGISLEGTYEYTIPDSLVVGGDVYGDFKFMQFNNGPLNFNFEIAPKIAFSKLSPNLFLRFGFSDLGIMKSSANNGVSISEEIKKVQDALSDSIVSPFVGIQFNNVKVGATQLSLDANYLLAGLINNQYQGASFKFYASTPFAEMEKVRLMFNIGVRDTLLLMKAGGVQNHASVIFGFGVENVIR